MEVSLTRTKYSYCLLHPHFAWHLHRWIDIVHQKPSICSGTVIGRIPARKPYGMIRTFLETLVVGAMKHQIPHSRKEKEMKNGRNSFFPYKNQGSKQPICPILHVPLVAFPLASVCHRETYIFYRAHKKTGTIVTWRRSLERKSEAFCPLRETKPITYTAKTRVSASQNDVRTLVCAPHGTQSRTFWLSVAEFSAQSGR